MTNTSSILNNKQAVQDAINGANSKKEVLHSLGLRAAGGNYRALRLACERHGLSLPQYDRGAQLREARAPRKFADDQVFVENSSYNRGHLKQRMFALGVPNICAECGQGPEWNGKPLTLQLDHINGIKNDNRFENLRILCPHCHSQTDTFAGRNRPKYEKKPSHDNCGCGNRKMITSPVCHPCSRSIKKIDWPSKKELRAMVKSNGYSATGRALGVSDNAVRKALSR